MYRRIEFAVCLLGCLWVGCLGGDAEPANQQADLGGLVDGAVANAPGCMGLAIGVEHEAARAERFYGDTGNHGRPNADTEFGIGSITKTFTATLLAHEDERGEIRVNEPLARYAPPGVQVPSFNGRPILMIHLADHTSGLPRRVPNIGPPLMPEAMWRFASSYRLPYAPGERYLYSNLGYGLLARAPSSGICARRRIRPMRESSQRRSVWPIRQSTWLLHNARGWRMGIFGTEAKLWRPPQAFRRWPVPVRSIRPYAT
jgi:hypothetical protein